MLAAGLALALPSPVALGACGAPLEQPARLAGPAFAPGSRVPRSEAPAGRLTRSEAPGGRGQRAEAPGPGGAADGPDDPGDPCADPDLLDGLDDPCYVDVPPEEVARALAGDRSPQPGDRPSRRRAAPAR
jgi:hypothetical protein